MTLLFTLAGACWFIDWLVHLPQDLVGSTHQMAAGGSGGAENGLLAPPHNAYTHHGERARAMSASGKVTCTRTRTRTRTRMHCRAVVPVRKLAPWSSVNLKNKQTTSAQSLLYILLFEMRKKNPNIATLPVHTWCLSSYWWLEIHISHWGAAGDQRRRNPLISSPLLSAHLVSSYLLLRPCPLVPFFFHLLL